MNIFLFLILFSRLVLSVASIVTIITIQSVTSDQSARERAAVSEINRRRFNLFIFHYATV